MDPLDTSFLARDPRRPSSEAAAPISTPSVARLPAVAALGLLLLGGTLSATGGNDAAGATTSLLPYRFSALPAAAGISDHEVNREFAASAVAEPAPQADPAPEPAPPAAPSGEFAERGAQLMSSLGLAHADPVTHADLLNAASHLGIAVDGFVQEAHLEAMEQAFLQRAKPAVLGVGVDPGERVDEHEVRAVAEQIGVEVSTPVAPDDVVKVLRAAPDHAGGPPPRFAVVAGINVRMPSRVPIMAGFHQASYANAYAMYDAGHPANAVLPSRARASARTSAIDVAVPPDTLVLAPIRGTVVEVTPYALYGKYPDYKIRMVPESDPNVLVSILHVTDPLVGVGQRLEAGDPLAGRATLFPFESQIDRYAGRFPHVHIEARRR